MSNYDDTRFYNFSQVLDAVYPRIDDLVHHLIPNAKKAGGSYRSGDETGEKGSSFSVSAKPANAGTFIDHSNPAVRGNAIGLWALVRSCSYDEAGRALAGFLGVAPEARLFAPKKRPEPKIVQTVDAETQKRITTFMCGTREIMLRGLSKRSVDFAQSRGITADTLRLAKCASTDSDIVFPHFDDEGKLVLIKCWPCDGTKNMYTNNDPVPVLFGKGLINPIIGGGELIITEGQWDALTWIQLGYPAVSIPSGAGNHEWIAEDWNFLNRFTHIYLDYDADATGREAELVVRTRLGVDRCRSIHYRHKDANDALRAGDEAMLIEAFHTARDAPIERIVRAQDVKERVRQRGSGHSSGSGTPFFLPAMDVEFRPHEIILWLGSTGHGKSSLLSNQICYGASLGKLAMVASFEQDSPMTILAMLKQYTANPDITSSEDFDPAYDELTSRVLFFDSMERTSPADIIATITLAHKQLGVTEFVVDNNMTLDVDRSDNTAQADVANSFRVLVARLPITLHLVVHPRKPKEGETNKPPQVSDIMGASEWGNISHKVICVWRDVTKSVKMAEMFDAALSAEEIAIFDAQVPDGKVLVRKQRETGELPMISYHYDKPSKRSWKNIEDARAYWVPEVVEPEPTPETGLSDQSEETEPF